MGELIAATARPAVFLAAGVVILGTAIYVMVRGRALRPRLSFFQVALATALYVVVAGTLLEPGRSPETLRASGDLLLLLGLLMATTLYQLVTHGLGFGPAASGPRERRQGVILLWGISAAVALLVAGGELRLVRSVAPAGERDPLLALHPEAVPVMVAVGAGFLGACMAAGRSWWRSMSRVRRHRAAATLAGVAMAGLLPVALHLTGLGPWGRVAGLAGATGGVVLMGAVARLEPLGAQLVSPLTAAVLQSTRGPALVAGGDGKIGAANDAFLEAFDRRSRDLVGESLEDLVDDATGSKLPLAELSLDDDESGRDVRVRAGDGELVRARVVACALGHTDGDALPSLYLFLPKPRQGRSTAVTGPVDRAVRHEFRASVPALAVADLNDGRLLDVNDQFLHLSGYGRGELVGRRPEEMDLLVGGDRWGQLLRATGERGGVEAMEVEVRRGGGGVKHAEFHGARLSTDEGERALLLARDVTARKRVEEELRDEVLYDALTGLPNRVLFREQLDHALQRAQRLRHRVGVLLIDLKGLREVNEAHGRAAGDQLLAGVAWRLYECFRQMDMLCRYGGDEFLVLLEDLEGPDAAAAAADRFRRYLETPFRLERDVEVRAEATVGVAVSVPGQTEPDDLIRWADAAMYRAKRRGESPIHVYDPEHDAGEMERLSRADDLRQAIEKTELTLLYQPLISLSTGRIVGAEALVRWPRPDGELRAPDRFLPLAEETGLIVPMSDWVFREAARRAMGWRELLPGFRMSVNVAAQHFREPALRDTLEEILEATGLPAGALELEITESAALRDDRAISRLRELGVRVAVDDFGTGYSSLEYIRGLGVDGVKIDRVFVGSVDEDEKDQAIVRAVLLMAEAFDLDVTAEGIETAEQLAWLREAECDVGQGFYFSPPVPPEEFEALLEEDVDGSAQ